MNTQQRTAQKPSTATGLRALLSKLFTGKGLVRPKLLPGARGLGGHIALAMTLATLAGLAGATPALAGQAWWHVLSGSRPTYLKAGPPVTPGVNEVEKVVVKATGGTYGLEEPAPGSEREDVLNYNASAAELRESLELHVYGAGNLGVTGGCKEALPPLSECEYEVTFKGALSGKSVGLASMA